MSTENLDTRREMKAYYYFHTSDASPVKQNINEIRLDKYINSDTN